MRDGQDTGAGTTESDQGAGFSEEEEAPADGMCARTRNSVPHKNGGAGEASEVEKSAARQKRGKTYTGRVIYGAGTPLHSEQRGEDSGEAKGADVRPAEPVGDTTEVTKDTTIIGINHISNGDVATSHDVSTITSYETRPHVPAVTEHIPVVTKTEEPWATVKRSTRQNDCSIRVAAIGTAIDSTLCESSSTDRGSNIPIDPERRTRDLHPPRASPVKPATQRCMSTDTDGDEQMSSTHRKSCCRA